LQEGAKIEDFKYLSKEKIFPVPTLSLSPLFPWTSKRLSMGGGGRYNAILVFKGEQKMRKKKKK
jgi:hypothetical protein